jgi:hypothetical protein
VGIFFVCFFTINFSFSQFSFSNEENKKMFDYKVKQINQFIDRFNLKEIPKGLENVSPQSQFAFLFNLYDTSLTSSSIAKEFIYKRISLKDSILIKLEYPNFYAQVVGKTMTSVIRMILEYNVGEKYQSWKIIFLQVKNLDSFTNISILDTNIYQSNTEISPVDNEIDFINLRQLIVSKNLALNNFSSTINKDDVNRMLNELFKIDYQNLAFYQTSFHNFQIPSYYFRIDKFNRKNINSGWLISKIEKFEFKNKTQYIQHLINTK